MLLRSYAFQKEVPDTVWNLFSKADKLGTGLDYTLEIIDAAMQGDINLNREFNLKGYIYSINQARKHEDRRRYKKNLRINYTVDDEADFGDNIQADNLSGYVESIDEYEKIDNDSEVSYAISEINRMSHDIMIFHNVDIETCLSQANRGMPESINLLRKLVNDNPQVGLYIQTILASGYPLETLMNGGEMHG